MIVNAWKEAMRNAQYGDALTVPAYMEVGTDGTAVDATDTALGTEVFRKVHDSKVKIDADTIRYGSKILVGEANGNDITEYSEVNAAAAGTIMNREVFATITKSSAFELRIETEVEFLNV